MTTLNLILLTLTQLGTLTVAALLILILTASAAERARRRRAARKRQQASPAEPIANANRGSDCASDNEWRETLKRVLTYDVDTARKADRRSHNEL